MDEWEKREGFNNLSGHNAMNEHLTSRCVAFVLAAFLTLPALAQVSGTGTATLTWMPPTQYTNGDPLPLSEIERYTIYWGTESGEYTESLDVENGAVQSREIDLEVTGPTTFYFAMSAWAHGLESDLSNEVAKTITLELDDFPPGVPQNVTVELSFSCETTEAGRTCRVVVE